MTRDRFAGRLLVTMVAAVLLACGGGRPVAGQAAAAVKFDSSRAWDHLRKQIAFGPRPSGSPALADTRKYIVDQLKALGIDAREQAFDADTPVLGRVKMAN